VTIYKKELIFLNDGYGVLSELRSEFVIPIQGKQTPETKQLTQPSCLHLFFVVVLNYLFFMTLDVSGFGGLGVSVLASGTQVRGFKPGQSGRIFKGGKILSTSSFGREVKPRVPCRRLAAYKKSLNVPWKSAFRKIYRSYSPPISSNFRRYSAERAARRAGI
jgi:hypothetical protein